MARRPQKLGPENRALFLQILRNGRTVTTAAEGAGGFHRARFYELRRKDEKFAKEWEDAEESGTDAIEDEARRRAVDGWLEPRVQGGKHVLDHYGNPIYDHKHSDVLMKTLLAGRRPKFRDNSKVEVGVAVGVQVNDRSAPADEVRRVLADVEVQPHEIIDGGAAAKRALPRAT